MHKEGHIRKCPFCDEKVYTSEGGYYKHINMSEYMKAQDTEENVNEENDDEQKDNSDSDKNKKKKINKKKKKDKDDKSENTEKDSQSKGSKRKKEVGSGDTDDSQPKMKKRKLETNDGRKKSQEVVDDKNPRTKKDTHPKRKSSEILEGVKSDSGKDTKGNLYPAKRTRSSGPVMWDCPFCKDKKYTDNLEYLVHLQKVHKCNLPGQVVKKEISKGKLGKPSKGKGKH